MGIGDELIVTGQCRVLQQRDSRRVRIVYERERWWPVYDGNPRIARPGEAGDFQELRPRSGRLRPYMAAKLDQRWVWKRFAPPRGEIYFTAEEKAFGAGHAGRIVLEPHNKPRASPNKDWGFHRWAELSRLLRERGLVPTQLGPAHTARLPAAEFVETSDFRRAAAVLATARAAVLPEGGLHHAAAAVGTPATVVIYGGFISPEVTGYADQVSLFDANKYHPLGCGWRTPCEHCRAALAAITPQRVFKELERALEGSRRDLAA